MHLLHTAEHKIKDVESNTPFAILSHTWGEDEVTFDDVNKSNMQTKKGYEKIKKFCSVATADGFDHVWVDTCCIDKGSSAELSEAINSMYRWYQEADVCYAFLEDVPDCEFSASRWFTRGWTLQELIAPSIVIFFDKNWEIIGTKSDLAKLISARTRIPVGILLGSDLQSASIAQRMSWASARETTRVEDVAYCLMGIFNVHMPMIYGEGERAFIRLQEEILKSSDDISLFAWRSVKNHGGLLATSQAAFSGSYDIVRLGRFNNFSSPISVDNQGIHLKLRFIPQNGSQLLGLAILNCTRGGDFQNPLAIYLEAKDLTKKYFCRVQSERLHRADLNYSSWPEIDMCVRQPRSARVRNLNSRKEFQIRQSTSPLSYAAKHGLTSMIKQLVKDDEHENTILLWTAAKKGDETLFKQLVNREGTDINSSIITGSTSLYVAAENGHEAIVRLLLHYLRIDPNSKSHNEKTPLLAASENGHEKVVELLLSKPGIDIGSRDGLGRDALSWAAMHGWDHLIPHLFSKASDGVTNWKERHLPLLQAAKEGYLEVVALLGMELEHTDGWMPLWLALMHGHEKTVKILLENESVDSDQWTELWLAVEYQWARACSGGIALPNAPPNYYDGSG